MAFKSMATSRNQDSTSSRQTIISSGHAEPGNDAGSQRDQRTGPGQPTSGKVFLGSLSSQSGTNKGPLKGGTISGTLSSNRAQPYQPKAKLSLVGGTRPQRPPSTTSSLSPATTPTPDRKPSTSLAQTSTITTGARPRTLKPTSAPLQRPAAEPKANRSFLQVHNEVPLAKQERALCAWLNSHLSAFGVEFNKQLGSLQEEPEAQALTLQRLTAQARGALCRQYKKNRGLYETLSRVYGKIDAGVFTLTDVPLVADVAQVQLLIEPLMSYHPFWLRLGLVTVLRDALKDSAMPGAQALLSEDRALRHGLQRMVREGLFCEAELQAASDKQACWLANRDLILKNLLLLVLLLDVTLGNAQASGLPKAVPPLFHITAKYKSSAEVLRATLSGRLRGMGDGLHHLDLWGYRLTHAQRPADEFDYSVVNMREDMRSGIRLAKLYDVITGCPPLLTPPGGAKTLMWLNPVCDQQRLDNVGRVLTAFTALGVVPGEGQRILTRNGPVPLRARDLVDAHRDITLALLWSVALKWQLPRLVSPSHLRAETALMCRRLQARTRRPAPEPLAVYQGPQGALHKWVQAVCALHGLKVTDFTTCFGDGRALCYLVATYLPDYLSVSDIYQPDAPKPEDVAVLIEGDDEDVDMETLRAKGWCAVYEAGGYIDDHGLLKSFKEGVRRNFSLVHSVATRLGRIPEMLNPEDVIEGGLEEKAVVLYVAHLASRLLELSREDRAAHIITQALRRHLWTKKYGPELAQRRARAALTFQTLWRRQCAMRLRVKLRREAAEREAARIVAERHRAATVIQAYVRGCKAREQYGHLARLLRRVLVKRQQLIHARRQAALERAAVVVQAAWRAHAARRRFLAARAGIVRLQAQARMLAARGQFLRLRGAAVLLQRAVRRHLYQSRLERQQRAATVIQTCWRGHVLRTQFLRMQRAALLIQTAWRGYAVRALVRRQAAAATAIQSCWRGSVVRREVQRQQQAARCMQALWRGRTLRAAFVRQRAAAFVIQAAWREWLAQHGHQRRVAAAVVIQSCWRMTTAVRAMAAQRAAAITIQTAYRRHAAMRQLHSYKRAALVLQSLWRRRQAMLQLQQHQAQLAAQRVRQQQAAVAIQAAFRGYAVRREVAQQRAAAVVIQAVWRGQRQRKAFTQLRRAVVLAQACVRRQQASAAFHRARAVATLIQTVWRGHAARSRFLQQRAAACKIQRWWCGVLCRRRFAGAQSAAVLIQGAVRGWLQRLRFQRMRRAAVTLQAAARAAVARRQLRERRAARAIQAAWRGHRQRQQLALQHAAAARVQGAWRGWLARQQTARAMRAVVRIQAAVRGWQARNRLLELRGAVCLIERLWLRRKALLHAQAERAATVMQSYWRARKARMELAQRRQQHAAATVMQAAVRAWAARREAAARAAAVVTLQRYARGMAARRQAAELRAIQEFEATAKAYMNTIRAALRIQSWWRGHLVRKVVQPVLRERQEQKRRHRAALVIQTAWRGHCARALLARNQAALATLTRFVPVFKARMQVLRARKLAQVSVRAAVVIQSYARMWLARRRAAVMLRALVRVQALWRGYHTRITDPRSRALAAARRKLAAAATNAKRAPHKSIGARVREALEVLCAKHVSPEQVLPAVQALQTGTRYSRACCDIIALEGGVAALLRLMRVLNRTKLHVDLLQTSLSVLSNICAHDALLPAVFSAPDAMTVLSEKLQVFRDQEDVFISTVSVVSRLLTPAGHALATARLPNVLKQWEGIAQIMTRKMDMERKYISRLESAKGSDVSARDSTRKVLAGVRQLDALQEVILMVTRAAEDAGVQVVHHNMVPHASGAYVGTAAAPVPAPDTASVPETVVPVRSTSASAWAPKNTLVRGVLREVVHNVGGGLGGAATGAFGGATAGVVGAAVAPGTAAKPTMRGVALSSATGLAGAPPGISAFKARSTTSSSGGGAAAAGAAAGQRSSRAGQQWPSN